MVAGSSLYLPSTETGKFFRYIKTNSGRWQQRFSGGQFTLSVKVSSLDLNSSVNSAIVDNKGEAFTVSELRQLDLNPQSINLIAGQQLIRVPEGALQITNKAIYPIQCGNAGDELSYVDPGGQLKVLNCDRAGLHIQPKLA